MKKFFSVGYNGRLESLKKILRASSNIRTVYTGGVENKIKGGRPQYVRSLDLLSSQVEYVHRRGIEFEVALNAPCIANGRMTQNWWKTVRRYFRDLQALGVDGLIVSHPFLIEAIKDATSLKVIVSTICEIMNVRSALYYEKLGGDVITPSININLDLKRLKLIRSSLKKATLRLIVNEHCLGDCPWRRFHQIHHAHSNIDFLYHVNCKKFFLREPYLLIANNAIRPEDLHYYREITNDFKIVGRSVSLADLLIRVRAYDRERFKGNYVSLIDSELAAIIKIPNEKLKGLFRRKALCDGRCGLCNYCLRLYRRLLKN